MTTDLEQTRRDAEAITRSNTGLGASEARALAREYLALLAKLEQAERVRAEYIDKAHRLSDAVLGGGARLDWYAEALSEATKLRERAEQAERDRDEARAILAERKAECLWHEEDAVKSEQREAALVEALRKIGEGDDRGWLQKSDQELARAALAAHEQAGT